MGDGIQWPHVSGPTEVNEHADSVVKLEDRVTGVNTENISYCMENDVMHNNGTATGPFFHHGDRPPGGGDDCKETVQPMDFGCSLYLVHNNKEDHP